MLTANKLTNSNKRQGSKINSHIVTIRTRIAKCGSARSSSSTHCCVGGAVCATHTNYAQNYQQAGGGVYLSRNVYTLVNPLLAPFRFLSIFIFILFVNFQLKNLNSFIYDCKSCQPLDSVDKYSLQGIYSSCVYFNTRTNIRGTRAPLQQLLSLLIYTIYIYFVSIYLYLCIAYFLGQALAAPFGHFAVMRIVRNMLYFLGTVCFSLCDCKCWQLLLALGLWLFRF